MVVRCRSKGGSSSDLMLISISYEVNLEQISTSSYVQIDQVMNKEQESEALVNVSFRSRTV